MGRERESGVERKEGGLRQRRQRRRKKKSRTEEHGLEKTQVLSGLIDVEDGSVVVVDLPNLGAQHVFILIELCFIARAYLGWRFTATLHLPSHTCILITKFSNRLSLSPMFFS